MASMRLLNGIHDQAVELLTQVLLLRTLYSKSRQLLRNVLVEDFLHRQGDDDFVAALEE